MRFVDSANGLTLKYQIQDVQKYASPPEPATNWKANYTESTGNDGAIGHADMYVMLHGAPTTPKKDLLGAAAAVVFERLADLQKTYQVPGSGKHATILTAASFTEHLEENVVELRVRVKHPVTAGFLNVQANSLGNPLAIAGYDPTVWPVPSLFDDSSHYGHFAKYLQSPCVDIHGITQATPAPPDGGDPGDDPYQLTQPEVFQSQLLAFDSPDGLDADQKGDFPYTYMTLENHYTEKSGVAHLPIAQFSQNQPNGDTSVAVSLFHPIVQRTFTMHAERVGDWPEIPEPVASFSDANNITYRLVSKKTIPGTPTLLPDGKSRLFSAQAKHVYALSRAPTDSEILSVPSDPRDQSTITENAFDGAAHYSLGRIN